MVDTYETAGTSTPQTSHLPMAHDAIVRRWVEAAWNQGDFTTADDLYAASYVLHDPSGPVHGPAALTQFARMFRAAFPDLRFTIEDLLSVGDKVVWRYAARGTHQGPLQGIPPTGKAVTVTGILISRFESGLWAEDWHAQDTLGMLQQLGVIPAPAPATA